ncbi:MAG: deoxyguanosinetriphosphate triphosphohydrolase [Acidobacteriota bacterium]|jgi:dGTPase
MSHLRDPLELAPYAARAEESEGRRYPEPEHAYRSCFERDRDRVIHARAFRRLEYKTQVFPNYEGDHFRTRLTHTIEVAQIARTVAAALHLNQTLAEAIALAHDLGHPPFGHAGEEELDELLADSGGFEHNRHSLRIVEELEERYAEFPGLNLSYEVREGIVKHTTRYDRFRHAELQDYRPQQQPLLEAQIIDWVDEIAYNVHDIDDGVEAHILSVRALRDEVPVFARLWERQRHRHPEADERACFNETIRALLDLLVTDLISCSTQRIRAAGIDSVEAVRAHDGRLVGHSEEVVAEIETIASFLMVRLYRSPRVEQEMANARRVIAGLVAAYQEDPGRLPLRHQARFEHETPTVVIADYVAGMTDRYALRAWRRLQEGR